MNDFCLNSRMLLLATFACCLPIATSRPTTAQEAAVAVTGQKQAGTLVDETPVGVAPGRIDTDGNKDNATDEKPAGLTATDEKAQPAAASVAPAVDVAALPPESHARALSQAFRDSARRALPSVVTILARSKRPGEESSVLDIISGSDDRLFDSVGSGVIIGTDGLILTNHHVIADTSRVEVRLSDGRQFPAVEQMSDPASDVALVRISANEALRSAEVGSSAAMQVGDWVLAIGSPFTLESSVSAGIISGTNRRQQLSRLVSGQFLQTDAAINPGNSGGPLIDLEGKVVGINTAISSRTGGFQGIGFAIPIDRAIWIKKELLEFGKVRRGFAGVRTSDVPYELSRSLNLPAAGALINAVTPDYPAYKAGLMSGDIVVRFAGQVVQGKDDFQDIVQQSPIGEAIPLKVLRGGDEIELMIELQERPN